MHCSVKKVKRTLDYHNLTEGQSKQCAWLANTNHCEFIHLLLVQMKLTADALKRKQQEDPEIGKCFTGGSHRPLLSLYSSWQYLQPIHVAPIIHLLQDAVTGRSAVSPRSVSSVSERYQKAVCYTRRAGQGQRRVSTQQQDLYLLLCERRITARTLINDLHRAMCRFPTKLLGLHEGDTRPPHL